MAARYLTTAELHERTGIPPATWRYWRMQGKGPAWMKPGRIALYPVDQFEAWEKSQLRVPISA